MTTLSPRLRRWMTSPSKRDATGTSEAARRAVVAALDRGEDPVITLPRALALPVEKSIHVTAFGDLVKGNANSGNWGHAGRPGQVGGSLPKGGGGAAVPGHRSAQTGRRYPGGVVPPPKKTKLVEPVLGALPPRDFTSLEVPIHTEGAISEFGGGINSPELIRDEDGSAYVFKAVEREHFHMRDQITNEEAPLAEREVLTSRVDAELGLGLVPHTVFAEHEGRAGSRQDFVAHDEVYEVTAPTARADLAKMGVLDVIIGNTDRHDGNWMATKDGKHLIAVDHGYTFGTTDRGDYIRSIALKNAKNTDLPVSEQRELARAIKNANWAAVLQGSHLDGEEVAALQSRTRIAVSRLLEGNLEALNHDFDVYAN